MSRHHDSLLRLGLRANAVFSGASALLLLTGSGPLADWIGAPRRLLLILGVALGLYAADLALTTRKARISRGKAVSFVAMDALWVVASIVVLLVPTSLTGPGRVVVALVALLVGALAVTQGAGLQRRRARRPGEGAAAHH